jgi:hypothetical protein
MIIAEIDITTIMMLTTKSGSFLMGGRFVALANGVGKVVIGVPHL